MSRFASLSAPRRALLLTAICVLAFVLLALLAEGAVRVRQFLKHDQPVFRIESLYHIDSETGLRVPVAGRKTDRIAINADGFRGPEIARPKPPGTVRIAFLGGSTTFSAEVSGNEATWPHLVTEGLKKRWPERQFDYINAGVPGYALRTSLKRFELSVKRFEPDIIVIYHATNDLSANSFKQAVDQGVIRERADAAMSWPSRYSLLWYLVEKNLSLMWIQAKATDQSNKLDVDLQAISGPFERDLTRIVDAARNVADLVALVTFSTHLRQEQDPEYRLKAAETSLFYMPYMTPQNLLDSFAAYNEVIRSVARRSDVLVIDAETAVPGDTRHFVDSVHFTDEGSAVMAQKVVDGLIAEGLAIAGSR